MIKRQVGESRVFLIEDKTYTVEIIDYPTDTGVVKCVSISSEASEVTISQETLKSMMNWLT